ncbi:hypothetical protein FEM03_08110 [Phragmitibacter flavus]|uniref:Uncharacterized protein n=1 Tax=Phragmitibacter flavus TaxID=2576071 RepID=A0A5R8KIP0_9BACT|nr:hypothetical protein [Phragmitibacter flavus]TLD71479.1 hypothetical protein FEM03_08110 [Phragmitibacter flavus]
MPSIQQIKQAIAVAEKIEALEAQLAGIWGTKKAPSAVAVEAAAETSEVPKKRGKAKKAVKAKRVMSPEAREKIAEAQRRRWAKSAKTK